MSMSTRSAPSARGSAIGRRPDGRRPRWQAGSLRSRSRLRRRPGNLDFLLRGLEQLLLGSKARALNRLAQLDPLDVVHLAELRLQLSARVDHQVEVHFLANQRVPGAEKVLNRVQRLDDVGFEAGL